MFGLLGGVGRELTRGLLQLLYPGACQLCSRPLPPAEAHLCASCRTALTADLHAICPRCAGTVGPFANVEKGCTYCRGEHFSFERVLRLGDIKRNVVLHQAILRLKHQTGEELAEILGSLWAAAREAQLRAVQADVIVPVPLHWRRRWQRGYNQSAALAAALAGHLRLPCHPRRARRTRATPDQREAQSPSQRQANVRGAFWAGPPHQLAGKSILLIDDVLTTGSTCNEVARALRAAGAARVVVAVLGRSHG
jgi:ComF family protein